MVTVREDRTAMAERAVGSVNHANGERLHAAREGVLILRFDDEVKMVGLDGELHHPEVVLLA